MRSTHLIQIALATLAAATAGGCTKGYIKQDGFNVSAGRDGHVAGDKAFVQPALIAYAVAQPSSNIANYYRVIASWEGNPPGGMMMGQTNQGSQKHFEHMTALLADDEKAMAAEGTAAKDWEKVGNAYAAAVARMTCFSLSQSILDYGYGRLAWAFRTTDDLKELKMAGNGDYVTVSVKGQTLTLDASPPHDTVGVGKGFTYDVSAIEGAFQCNEGDDGASLRDLDSAEFLKKAPEKCKILQIADIAPKMKLMQAPAEQ